MTHTGKLWLLSIWLLVAVPAAVAQGLEPGELVVHSAPGQALRASIPIVLPEGLSLASLQVAMATEEQYRQRGLSRPAQFDTLRFGLLARGEQRARIQLFADTPWQGGIVELLLQLSHPGEEQLLAYTIQSIAAAETAEYITVGRDETLDSVALRLADRHNRSYLHMMYALYRANPGAFYRDNMNNLRGASLLRLPSSEDLYRFDDAEAFAAIREHQTRWQSDPREPIPPAEAPTDHINLERDRDQLLAELKQVSAEESRFASQNQALREQLLALESRVSRMGAELFAEPEAPPIAQPVTLPQTREKPPAPRPEDATLENEGLPAWPLLLLMALVLLIGVVLQHRLRQRTRSHI